MKASTIKKALGTFKSVRNMRSSNGNDVPNQFELRFEHGTLFQSYESIIAIKFFVSAKSETLNNRVVIGADYDYSNTTMKYLKKFLWNDGVADTRKRIASNEYMYCEEL